MATLIERTDWRGSPLGPIESWSPALVYTVSLMLPTDAQIVLFWGPQHVALYNDSYSPSIGDKHPAALGRPAVEHWGELWDDLEPLLRGVCETGKTYSAKDRQFYIERAGFGEEVYFDISYSAVREADGSVGGVLCIVSETTDRVRAQRRTAAENERLETLFETAPSFMAVMRGPDHVFELANPAYLKLIGREGDNILGKPVREVLPEIEGQGFFELLDTVRATGEPFSATGAKASLRAADGGAIDRYIDFVYQPIRDASGAITGVFVEGHDVTPQVENKQRLELSEESLRLAYEAAGIGKWDVDLVNDTLDWDERTKGMFGFPPEANCTLADFYAGLHPEDLDATSAAFDGAIDPALRQPYDVEYRTIGATDGVVRWVAATGLGLFDRDGRCTRAIGTAIDITRRRAQEAELRESEARFRALADAAPALIWIASLDDGVVFMNRWASKMLGRAPESLLGQRWTDAFRPVDVEQFVADLPEKLAARSVFPSDVQMVRADGSMIWVHAETQPRMIDGEIAGFVGVAIDITEAHDAAAALERAVAERTGELASANSALTLQIAERERVEATLTKMQRLEAVGQLTSGVAHDFNNLLTVVLGNLDMIERRGAEVLDDRSRERLRHMRSAAERGATLTAQLLAFSRRTRLETKAVDLNATVNGMQGLLESTLGGSVEIRTRLSSKLWPALVDATQIELAILNLAINGRDAMEVGGALTIATANRRLGEPVRKGELPPGDYVVVSVSDDGSGMTEEVLARALEPFFTTKEVGKGSGLGLAQVYGFARQSGGGVAIETVPGKGTTVHIFLQRADRFALPMSDGDVDLAPSGAFGLRALVVDDDDGVRAVTADLLRELGYDVDEADGGAAALDMIQSDVRIDVLVADFAMPGMNGAELARRAELARPGLPVLIVTGFADLAAIAHLGEGRIVQKPYQPGEIEQKLSALLAGG